MRYFVSAQSERRDAETGVTILEHTMTEKQINKNVRQLESMLELYPAGREAHTALLFAIDALSKQAPARDYDTFLVGFETHDGIQTAWSGKSRAEGLAILQNFRAAERPGWNARDFELYELVGEQ